MFFPFVLQRDPLLDGVKSSASVAGNSVPQCGVLGLSPRSLPCWGAHQAHGCKHHPHRQSSVTLSHPQLRCDGSPRHVYPTLMSNRQTTHHPHPSALSPRHPQLTPSRGCCSILSVAQAGPPRLLRLLFLLHPTSTQSGNKPGSSFRTRQDLITSQHLPCPSHMGILAPAPHGPSSSHMTCPQHPQTSFPNV